MLKRCDHDRHAQRARDDAQRIAGLVVPGLPNCIATPPARHGGARRAARAAARQLLDLARSDVSFSGQLTPDDAEAIAAFAYMQMLETASRRSANLHDLPSRHRRAALRRLGEMAGRIAAAASETGIGLTLLPTLYIYGGFGGAAPNEGQKRFSTVRNAMRRCSRVRARSSGPCPMPASASRHIRLRRRDAGRLALCHRDLSQQTRSTSMRRTTKEVRGLNRRAGSAAVAWLLDNANVDARCA